MPVSRTLALAVTALLLTGTAAPVAAAPTHDDERQRDFSSAAAEYGVPERVLLGVAYLQSRWDANAGTPSTAAGYGPMHLTDVETANSGGSHHDEGTEDPRGDDARAVLTPEAGTPDLDSPMLRTAGLAAELTGLDAAELRTEPAANIRGGAALLAHYQREIGPASADPAAWYGAVARYSGATDTGAASTFADEVFTVLREGAERTTDDGQHVRLAASPALTPDTSSLARLGLRHTDPDRAECPRNLGCEWIPAPYQELPGNDYGNHDQANRPVSQKVEYILIHDTEATWDTTLRLVTDPTYVSWHYSLRSSDGHIAQHVRTEDIGWHAGNWYVNAKSIGLEHEGFAAQGSWYTEAMYRTSAKLVRYLAKRHDVPLDRAHIIGHDNVPGTTPANVRGMHWDPGPYWDWAHYMDLLGAPIKAKGGHHAGLVTINPDYRTNQPAFTGCVTAGMPCAPRGSTSVVLRGEPRDDATLLVDIGLRPNGTPSTMHISDHGSRVETGQRFAVADRQGDWTAVWYLGQKGWFRSRDAVPARGSVVTAKPGVASVPVYGRAYPEAAAYPAGVPVQSVVPLQYSLPAGQTYALGLSTPSEYYWATTFDATNHTVVRGEQYLQIQFGHRIAYVRAADVDVRRA
ncbi:N-acetylmuramoyl-L-alanine amidase [Actinokineospora sp.]|uniref:N-acetylmuramoyl-L-alanine amidase n=1 Tax=Actinokineospora sp. TaxID=1872133 RepID=UPI004037F362